MTYIDENSLPTLRRLRRQVQLQRLLKQTLPNRRDSQRKSRRILKRQRLRNLHRQIAFGKRILGETTIRRFTRIGAMSGTSNPISNFELLADFGSNFDDRSREIAAGDSILGCSFAVDVFPIRGVQGDGIDFGEKVCGLDFGDGSGGVDLGFVAVDGDGFLGGGDLGGHDGIEELVGDGFDCGISESIC